MISATHRMHAEWGEVRPQAAAEINATRAAGGRIIPVGTTALRLIESAGRAGEIAPWRGETDIFIRPGFEFRVADGLMTNFHLPKSTLMMLVSALMGAGADPRDLCPRDRRAIPVLQLRRRIASVTPRLERTPRIAPVPACRRPPRPRHPRPPGPPPFPRRRPSSRLLLLSRPRPGTLLGIRAGSRLPTFELSLVMSGYFVGFLVGAPAHSSGGSGTCGSSRRLRRWCRRS